MRAPSHVLMVLLCSAFGRLFVDCMFFSVSPPSSPYSFSFSTELQFSVTGVWTGAGFGGQGSWLDVWVGQAYRVFYQPKVGWRYQLPGP